MRGLSELSVRSAFAALVVTVVVGFAGFGTLAEQASASTHIAQSVEGIARMSEGNAAAVNGMAASARRLEKLARELSGSVEKFRVGA